jgi:hypothetical protein
MLTLHSTRESHGKDAFARLQHARERRSVETPCASLHARYTRISFGMRLSNAHVSAHIRYNRTKVRDVSPARVTLWDGRDVAEQKVLSIRNVVGGTKPRNRRVMTQEMKTKKRNEGRTSKCAAAPRVQCFCGETVCATVARHARICA